ncbi:sensor histidine kinase [Peribacillus acanthi]|uniref:sensor histidine kinase n=1 Tax=Peribacillus acanthi TaxID=2171554 RepID=UPI000D3E8DE9|nr:ATP-binding protein [Peribacillus acanthi]
MKFKSIFHKLLVYYITTTLITIGLLAFILNVALQELLLNKKETLLNNQAEQIIDLIKHNETPTDRFRLEEAISYNKRFYNIRMNIIFTDKEINQRHMSTQRNQILMNSAFKNPKRIERVLAGEKLTKVGLFNEKSDEILLTVGVPIKDHNLIIGALFLHTPVQEIPTSEVSKLIFLVSSIIAIPSSLSLYWLSRRISKPLVQMNLAAKDIGVGKFKKRLEVESQDEVGQLTLTFNQMAEQLERLENMRKELIMNVSHELRTPLTSVRGFIQGMKEGVIPANDSQRYLDICYSEINRLSSLLNTMLDLSAIESGRIDLQKVIIRWDSLVQSVADNVKVRMDEKNITFHCEQQDQIPLKIYGDPERLKQILFNILDNAIRHTPENGAISILSKNVEHEIVISISDNGNGIDPYRLPHIWERFYTEDTSRKSHRERSGLGLTITKQLVELMGGRISVQSTVGKGTTFTLYLLPPPIK